MGTVNVMKKRIILVNRYKKGTNTYHDLQFLNMDGELISVELCTYGYERQYEQTACKLLGYDSVKELKKDSIFIVTDNKKLLYYE